MTRLTPEEIDDLLPQTQCGLCGFGGCMPYAEALVFEKAPINRCPPGGVDLLYQLGDKLAQDITPYVTEMQAKQTTPLLAHIREAECIGCTKCIQACPVDAIMGSGKQMHTVLVDHCTGCQLCVPPCPVDCIDLLDQTFPLSNEQKNRSREHFIARQTRLNHQQNEKNAAQKRSSAARRQDYIQAALLRHAQKKAGK